MYSKIMHVGIVLSVLAYVVIVSGADQCPANLHRSSHLRQYGGKCYEFIFNHPGDWYHANSDCRGKGGVLVDIIEPTEQSFIYNSLQVLGFAHDKGVWIGLTDEPSEGHWRWASGRTLEYKHWASGQPGLFGGLEDCAMMEFKDGGYWHDYPCHGILFNTQNHGWVCKYNMVQPSTAAFVPSTKPMPTSARVPTTSPMPMVSTSQAPIIVSSAMPHIASSMKPMVTSSVKPMVTSSAKPMVASSAMSMAASSAMPMVASTSNLPVSTMKTTAGFETRAPMSTAGFETRAPRTSTVGFETRAPQTTSHQ